MNYLEEFLRKRMKKVSHIPDLKKKMVRDLEELALKYPVVALVDLTNMPLINSLIEQYFKPPYPARTSIGVKELPRGGLVEIDAIMVIPD